MTAVPAHMEFAPPPTPGLVRSLALAIVAHALLLAVLAFGVQWKRGNTPVTVDAELWSELPVDAATLQPEQMPLPPSTITRLAINETSAEPSPAVAAGIELVQEKAIQHEQHRLRLLDQLEQEKRSREALDAKKLKAEMEAQDTNADSDEIPLRDPT